MFGLGLKRKLLEIKIESYVHEKMWGTSGAFHLISSLTRVNYKMVKQQNIFDKLK